MRVVVDLETMLEFLDTLLNLALFVVDRVYVFALLLQLSVEISDLLVDLFDLTQLLRLLLLVGLQLAIELVFLGLDWIASLLAIVHI